CEHACDRVVARLEDVASLRCRSHWLVRCSSTDRRICRRGDLEALIPTLAWRVLLRGPAEGRSHGAARITVRIALVECRESGGVCRRVRQVTRQALQAPTLGRSGR